jgi:hypothetical protein
MKLEKDIKSLDFDSEYYPHEQLPKTFQVTFEEVGSGSKNEVRVTCGDKNQVGDIINDNSYENDYYRYHDVFHFSFAALLGWSPCTRAMMKLKRKSNLLVDEIEDGARATITEEAISLILFNEAKRKKFFSGKFRVSKATLNLIKQMTENFEVKIRTSKEWEYAILKAYEAFRFLISNKGGVVKFSGEDKQVNIFNLQHDSSHRI